MAATGVDPLNTRLQATEGGTFKLGAGLYHQPPQPFELWRPEGTVDLGFEQAFASEVGWEQTLGPAISADVALFYKRLDDLIVQAPGFTDLGSAYFVNAGIGRVYGSELMVRHARGPLLRVGELHPVPVPPQRRGRPGRGRQRPLRRGPRAGLVPLRLRPDPHPRRGRRLQVAAGVGGLGAGAVRHGEPHHALRGGRLRPRSGLLLRLHHRPLQLRAAPRLLRPGSAGGQLYRFKTWQRRSTSTCSTPLGARTRSSPSTTTTTPRAGTSGGCPSSPRPASRPSSTSGRAAPSIRVAACRAPAMFRADGPGSSSASGPVTSTRGCQQRWRSWG